MNEFGAYGQYKGGYISFGPVFRDDEVGFAVNFGEQLSAVAASYVQTSYLATIENPGVIDSFFAVPSLLSGLTFHEPTSSSGVGIATPTLGNPTQFTAGAYVSTTGTPSYTITGGASFVPKHLI